MSVRMFRSCLRLLAAAGLAIPLLTAGSAAAGTVREASVQAMAEPGDVFAGYRDPFNLTTGAGQQVVVGRLNVPAGAYTIFAKAYTTVANNGYPRTLRCYLDAQGDWDTNLVTFDGVTPNIPIVLTANHVFPGSGTITLSCGFEIQSGSTQLRFVKINAIAARNLSNIPLF
jgi:hypothetical protein